MRLQQPNKLKTFRGVLNFRGEELSLLDEFGTEKLIKEGPRTRGLRNLVWEPVTIIGWLTKDRRSRNVIEVVDFLSADDPPEQPAFLEVDERSFSCDGDPIQISEISVA